MDTFEEGSENSWRRKVFGPPVGFKARLKRGLKVGWGIFVTGLIGLALGAVYLLTRMP